MNTLSISILEELGLDLVRNLEEQGTGYERYGQLLQAQHRALIAGDLTKLDGVNPSIDSVVSDLLRLEVDREAVTDSILEQAGIKPQALHTGWFTRPVDPTPPIKCETLAVYLSIETSTRLFAARNRLHSLLENTRNATRVNSALASNGQRMISAVMATMTSIVGRTSIDHLATYNLKGESQVSRRQVRSLVNRKG